MFNNLHHYTYDNQAFTSGDEIILAKGSYPGTLGVFLNLRPDHNWADIRERNGNIRQHPVAWMALASQRLLPAREITQ